MLKTHNPRSRQWHTFGFFLFAFFLDQFSKFFAVYGSFPVVINHGVSFGLWSSTWLVLALGMGLGALYLWSCDRWSLLSPGSRGIFFGAAVSNLVDRVALGGVRDWLPVPGFHLTNNLADWMMALALLWLGVQWRHGKAPVSHSRGI